MTSPFNWKKNGQSKIGQELQKDANRSASARSKSPSPGITIVPSLEPRRFHVYSKAGVK